MLEVAVIGSGASGLAASRHLIANGMRPVIFDVCQSIGGAWNVDDASPSFKMWDCMTTNLSKHTCRFSDLPWPDGTPTFPTVHHMHRYFQAYADAFIVDDSHFKFGCEVINVVRCADGQEGAAGSGESGPSYTVEWRQLCVAGNEVNDIQENQPNNGDDTAETGETKPDDSTISSKLYTKHKQTFDGVVVATGFFSTPHIPEGLLRPDFEGKVLHSSKYRNNAEFHNQTVAVIGSGFSGMEIAANVASRAKKVIHVVPTVPWVVPRYLPSSDTFVPIDVAFYSRQHDAPSVPQQIAMSQDACKAKHDYLRQLVGSKQARTMLGQPSDQHASPPFVTISDDYLNLLASGSIEVVRGRAVELTSDRTMEVDMHNGGENNAISRQSIAGIDSVIACTGYTSNCADILDQSIRDTLQYDATLAGYSPFVSCWDTIHPDLPRFGFCGMYRGPYLGAIELQARLVAKWCAGTLHVENEAMQQALLVHDTVRAMDPKPQFPNWDYVGYVDTMATHLGMDPSAGTLGGNKGDFVSPAFFQSDAVTKQEAYRDVEQDVSGMQTVVASDTMPNSESSKPAPFPLAETLLRSMVGNYTFERSICHFNDNNRKETISGRIKYVQKYDGGENERNSDKAKEGAVHHKEQGTANGAPKPYVLYREDGIFQLTPTKALEVFREYEYIVTEHGDLEIYFVENGQRTYIFLNLRFQQEPQPDRKSGNSMVWVATSDHLCVKDLYKGTFEIQLQEGGLSVEQIVTTYRVRGPQKDYESRTVLMPA